MNKAVLKLIFIVLSVSAASQTVKSPLNYSVSTPKHLNKKTPVLILLHGFGSNESDLYGFAKKLDDSVIVFSLRGPWLSRNGGYCWYDLEFLPDKQFRYDYKKAEESGTAVMAFISKACKAYKVDSNKVFILGFSQGAIMAQDIAVSNPKKIRGVISLSGRTMEETKKKNADWASFEHVRFFIAHGKQDGVIDISELDKTRTFLQEKKVKEVTSKKYEMPHTITQEELADIKNWLKNNR